MPCAMTACSRPRPISRAAASVAPKAPTSPVGWKPTWWKPLLATTPTRVETSMAAT